MWCVPCSADGRVGHAGLIAGVAHTEAGYRALAMYGAAATLLYAICLVLSVRLRWVTSRKPASVMEMAVTPPVEGPC